MIRNTEPHQNSSSSAPESSGPSEEIAPPMPDHSAIDLVRPGPDQSAVIRASVVGIRHAGGEPAQEAGHEEDLVRRRPRGEQARRNRQRHAQDQHQLAPVAVAERAEVEHRRGEAQGVADRDQIERGLRRSRTPCAIEGRATFATARFRLATAATRMSEARTSPDLAGAVVVSAAGDGPIAAISVISG